MGQGSAFSDVCHCQCHDYAANAILASDVDIEKVSVDCLTAIPSRMVLWSHWISLVGLTLFLWIPLLCAWLWVGLHRVLISELPGTSGVSVQTTGRACFMFCPTVLCCFVLFAFFYVVAVKGRCELTFGRVLGTHCPMARVIWCVWLDLAFILIIWLFSFVSFKFCIWFCRLIYLLQFMLSVRTVCLFFSLFVSGRGFCLILGLCFVVGFVSFNLVMTLCQ